MGTKLNDKVDPEMLTNLDVLMNYDTLQEEDSWQAIVEMPDEALEEKNEKHEKEESEGKSDDVNKEEFK